MHPGVASLLAVSKAGNIQAKNDTVCMYGGKLCANQVNKFSNKSDAS
jgi:hypothetical protein